MGAGQTGLFALAIKNTGTGASAFSFVAPTLPTGWSLQLFDALENGQALDVENAVTPLIDPGQSVTWSLKLTATAGASTASVPVRFAGGAFFDEVKLDATLQELAGLQWSLDGKTWTDVTAQTLVEVEQMDTFAVRALKRVPDAEWPDEADLGPTWTFQGEELVGETLWLHAAELTEGAHDLASATLGKTLTIAIKVVPGDALITYDTP